MLTIFGVEQPLNAVHIVGVLFLLWSTEAQFIQHLVFDVLRVGDRGQFLFRAIFGIPAALFMLLEVSD